MEDHLKLIETKIALYKRGLEAARGQLKTVESIFENSAVVLEALCPRLDPENWIQADKSLMMWTEEHINCVQEVSRYEALLYVLQKRHATVELIVGPDPLA